MAFDWGGAGQGAISGASTGAMFGPWGAVIGGAAGGLLGGLGGGGGPDISGIESQYDKTFQEVRSRIAQAEALGRKDIADSLRKAYGISEPYMQAGTAATKAWLSSVGLGPEGERGMQGLSQKFMQSPRFQYATRQAELASQRRAAASGLGRSGAETRELQAQAQGQAQQDWTNWLSNYQTNLARLAGMGQATAGQMAGMEFAGGQSLARLGYGYSGMDVGLMQDIAQSRAEAELAAQGLQAKSRGSWLSGLGKAMGGFGENIEEAGGFKKWLKS